jgi:hypothetical protein
MTKYHNVRQRLSFLAAEPWAASTTLPSPVGPFWVGVTDKAAPSIPAASFNGA